MIAAPCVVARIVEHVSKDPVYRAPIVVRVEAELLHTRPIVVLGKPKSGHVESNVYENQLFSCSHSPTVLEISYWFLKMISTSLIQYCKVGKF